MVNKKILLVEDESIESLDIKRVLESFGYQVPYVASSSEEAVEKTIEIMPDLILMDIVLKGDSNGIGAVSKIKDLNIPVIYLTAHSEESTIERAKLTEPYGYIIKPYDPTELKYAIELAIYKNQTKKELKQNEKRFRHILENSLDVVYRRNLDSDEYDYLSPMIEQVLGYSTEEFISMPSTEVVELIHPHDRENVSNIFANAFSGKTKTYNIEYRFKQKNGHYKWVNDFGSIVKDGDIMFLIGSVYDITERKKGEERRKNGEKALRESEEKYRAMMNYSSDAIVLTDFEGNFVECNKNAEELFGYSQEELIKLNFRDIHPSEELEVVQTSFKKIIMDDMGTVDTLVLTKDNKKVPVAITGSLIEYGDKTIIQGMFRDITERKESEESLLNINKALKKRDEEFKYFIDSAPVAIAMFDKRMRYIAASLRWIEDYNLEGQELHGISHYDIFPEITDEVKEVHKRALTGSIERADDDKFVRADGRVQYIRWEVHPWYLSSGDIGGIIIFSEDVSERINAEKKFRDNEEKYRTLFESNPDYTIIVGLDGIILDFNVAAEQIIGIFKDELIGKHLMDLGILPKDELDLLEEKFSLLVKHGEVAPFEFRIIDKNGDIRWGETSLTLIMGENGPAYILVIFNDITERKIAEKKLRSSQIQLVNAMEMSNLVNWEYDVASDTFTFDHRFYDLYGTTVEREGSYLMSSEVYAREFVHPDDHDMVADETAKAIETSDPDYVSMVEHRIIRRDGNIRHLVVRIAITKDSEGRTIKTHGTNQDITELKEKEEEIKKSLEEKEVLLREIHHRVKNNMQIISSLLNLQIQHVEDREAENVLKESQGRVKSMAMLHEKLYQSPNFTNINFKEYIERLVFDIFYSYGIKTGSIESELDIEDIKIGIETAIPVGLIINELVTNSIKYAFPKYNGTIKIEFKSSEEGLELIVADDGIGLQKDIDPKNTETLGLQLVNSLTDQIDGNIELDRSNGTKFKITFKELDYKERL
ncbi:PAS domain S-box protein [Methanobacterium congolense]|uniref:histidine kinase n=1 Tax=Methanobacterium congolense TaxID=118062 RepID=A0A1D3L0N8_9EURY|nr:PAS domain S-box protein [Methanobacterium congolense]SCG85222.1 putative sensor histidine kinase pdtaS [Methanobacterium congolense]